MPDARQVIPWQMRDAAAKPAGMMTVVQMPLHPHNAPLQWWMELGLPGAALGALAGIAAVAAAMRARNDPAGRAAALGLVAAGMTVAVISYGAWQSWWLFAMYLAAAGMTAATRPA
jgi:O-antigen ligase